MKHRPKHIAEYAALRAVSGIVNILPYRLAMVFGWLLAALAYLLARGRVVRARDRIREVFGQELDTHAVNRAAWISLRNVFFNGVEMMRVRRLIPAEVERTTDREGFEKVLDHAHAGKGGILVVPHMGNWDLAGVGAHMLGLPIFLIVGKQKNPLTDAWLNRVRGVTGIELVPRDSSVLKKAIRSLREGKILTFMTDLRSKTPGVVVRFFGKEANVVGGMALFARQAGVPIFPAVVTRVGWTRHRWRVFDPIHPDPAIDKEADWQRMTQQVMDIFDKAAREEPEQYFWYNKRWILDPLEPQDQQHQTSNAKH
ncbi:MAG: lysophospholipid acyltransferase family protein [bacterium]